MTTTQSQIIALTLNGFHGYQTSNVRATFTQHDTDSEFGPAEDGEPWDWDVVITESAARKFSCTASDCRCGEGVPTTFTCDQYDFEHGEVTLSGNYPQR